MFIQTIEGTYINLDHVSVIDPVKPVGRQGGEKAYKFKLGAGGSITGHLANYALDNALDGAASSVPASPGYFVLSYHPPMDGQPEAIVRDPVVAWRAQRILGEGVYAEPITPVGFSGTAVLMPDGRVTDPYSGTWENVDRWLEMLRGSPPDDTQ